MDSVLGIWLLLIHVISSPPILGVLQALRFSVNVSTIESRLVVTVCDTPVEGCPGILFYSGTNQAIVHRKCQSRKNREEKKKLKRKEKKNVLYSS